MSKGKEPYIGTIRVNQNGAIYLDDFNRETQGLHEVAKDVLYHSCTIKPEQIPTNGFGFKRKKYQTQLEISGRKFNILVVNDEPSILDAIKSFFDCNKFLEKDSNKKYK